jgi:hypothetical protein
MVEVAGRGFDRRGADPAAISGRSQPFLDRLADRDVFFLHAVSRGDAALDGKRRIESGKLDALGIRNHWRAQRIKSRNIENFRVLDRARRID